MIKKLYECGCFDYQKFILNHSKSLSLSSDEAIVLIKMLDEFSFEKKFSKENTFKSLSISNASLDQALASLMERDFYEIYISYDDGLGEESISLDGFFNKVYNILDNKASNKADELYSINQLVSSKINRVLTSIEFEMLTSLVSTDRYTLNDFNNAINKLEESKKMITLKNIAVTLAKLEEEETRETPSFVMDFFNNIK